MNKALLNGIQTYSFASTSDLIAYSVQHQQKSLIAVNAEKILHANDATRELINQNIGYADGVGAVWALRKKGFAETIKIPGCELWLKIIDHFYKEKTFYLVGAKEEIIKGTVEKLKTLYPGINILGYQNGYINSRDEQERLLDNISHKKPDIVFVAMGSPRQELFIAQMQQKHKAIYQGVGGSFDVFMGNVERAPAWWVNNNLEWAHRLIKQPSRIKRQIHLLRFFAMLQTNRL